MTADEPRSNPYPGLRPFEAHEAHLFFGRDEQIDELLRRLRGHRFLALVGTSGSGKSSLVRAGLLPALFGGFMVKAGAAWRIATMKPGADPIGNLAYALNAPDVFGRAAGEGSQAFSADMFTEVTLRRGPLGLVEATRHAGLTPDENLLVLVDQFEELFRFARLASPDRADDPARFVTLLLEAARHPGAPIYVVLTMRSEYLGDCARFRGLAEAINEGQYLVPRLARDQLREAVVAPARVGGADVTPRLVQQLLGDAGDEPNQLPVLQHALMRTWDLRGMGDPDGPLDLPAYLATGGMAEALSRHVNDVFDSLPDDRSRAIARTLFVRLTETRDGISVRRPTRLGEICDVTGAGEAEVIRVVEAFRRADRSFVTPADAVLDRESTLDISHESLISLWDRLKVWRREEQASADQYRRLCEGARLQHEQRGSLWRGPELDIALRWREQQRPTSAWAARYDPAFEEAMSFLARSEVTERRERVRRRVLVAGTLCVVFGAMAFALLQARRAEGLANAAELDARIRAASAVKEPLIRALLLADLGGRADPGTLPLEALQEAATAAIPRATLSLAGGAALQGAGFLDGTTVAALTGEGTLARWRSDGAGEPQPLEIRQEPSAGASPDSPLKASFSRDGRWVAGWNDVDVWIGRTDGSTGFRNAGPIVRKVNTSVAALAFSPDGGRIAVGYSDRTARVWRHDPSGGAPLQNAPLELTGGHSSTIASAAFDRTGTRLALGDQNGTVRIWPLEGRAAPGPPLGGGNGPVRSVAFSPDGDWVVCGYGNRVARLWRTSGDPGDAVTFAGHETPVTVAAFSPDGSTVLTLSEDRALVWTVRLVERGEAAPRRVWEVVGAPLTLIHGGRLSAGTFSQDGRMVVTGAQDGTARVWWSQSQEPRVLGLHAGRVESIAFSRDATRVVTASDDGTARIWSLDGRTAPVVLEGHSNWVRSAMFNPSDDRQVVTASEDGTVRLWTLGSPIRARVLQEGDRVFGAAFDPRGARVVTAVADNTARIWKTSAVEAGGNPLAGREASGAEELRHADWVLSAAFDRDAGRVVTASKNGRVSIWPAGAREPERVLEHAKAVYDAAFSPDGSKLVTASDDTFARIWFLDGSQSSIALPHPESVDKASFSGDGRQVVTASRDGTATVWDAATGFKRIVLRSGPEAVRAVRFTPSATEVVTGTADGLVRLWRIETTALLRHLQGATTACLDRRTRVQFLGESVEDAARRVSECEAAHGRRVVPRQAP